MTRTISSSQTFWVKFFFPVLWIGVLVTVTLLLFLRPEPSGPEEQSGVKWVFLVCTVSVIFLIYRVVIRLKRVRMSNQALYVSNYRREIRIPLEEVEEVAEIRWMSPHPVAIKLRRETDFGREVLFMPKERRFSFLSPHPVVGEILGAVAMVQAVRAGSTGALPASDVLS